MYYYLLEDTLEKNQRRFRERLADQTTDFGIAGEIVAKSSLKSVEELVSVGLTKGYTTIVAVGSDSHISQVATALLHIDPAERPVFGAIPTDPESMVAILLNTTSTKEALQALKYRRLAYASVTQIEPNKFMLTQATIHTAKPTDFEIDIDTAHISVKATDIILTGDCRLEIRNHGSLVANVSRGLAWFVGTTLQDNITSLFHGEHIRVNASASLPLMMNNSTIATTPFAAHCIRRALKIIVSRAIVSTDTKTKSTSDEKEVVNSTSKILVKD